MIILKDETKTNLEYLLGLKLEELEKMDVDEEISTLEKTEARKIRFSKERDFRKIGRGNPLLARRRMRTMDDVNKGLDKMKW
ncbi:MAG: hypothetical protein J6A56_04320 [Clostridia bacterium]|nr:hypothetical protein [Clostridia bacterium]